MVKKLALTTLIASVFAFIATASGEVLRLHSRENATDQATVVPDVSTPVSDNATAPKLTGKEKRAEAAEANTVVEAPALVVAPPVTLSTTTPKLTGREKRAEAAAAASSLTDVTPLFLPTTPAVTTIDASGEQTGHRFKKSENVISTPINFAATPLAIIPEPASTSLLLIGLFATGMFFVRRYQSRQA
jgi:hypothetical protein